MTRIRYGQHHSLQFYIERANTKPSDPFGLLCRDVFTSIVENREGQVAGLSLPVFGGSPYRLSIKHNGRMSRELSKEYRRYIELIEDLQTFNADRIRECAGCKRIFEGRKNQQFCRDACRQAQWRRNNPDAYREYQQKRDQQRKERRLAQKRQRETEQVARTEGSDARVQPRASALGSG